MVGDDLKLDVHPALLIGMKAVHLRSDVGRLADACLPACGHMEISALDDLLQACPTVGDGGATRG